ncbi:Protein of unknown function, putative [Plasmodium vivax]|uniref:Variable surface protein n=1 Tax=Plasmodium vivax TaxID=5855 RepID=A0A1G4ECK8_PLAVI|nr:Protein of unknown function, putative [Plasmodium vivax]
MLLLGKYNMKDSLNLVVFLNFFTFMFLVWNPENDVCHLGKDLEIKYKHHRSSSNSFNRLLAKNEYKEELDDLNLGENLVDYETPLNINNEEDVTSTYEYLKKRKPINLYSYKKGYKHRYSKKKGLAKIDCYCEQLLFNKFDNIYYLAENNKHDKKSYKKKFMNKYGYTLILFSLIPFLGLIYPMVFNEHNTLLSKCCFKGCTKGHKHSSSSWDQIKIQESMHYTLPYIEENTWNIIDAIQRVTICISVIIVLCVIFYILVKVIKYERLKACKDKMSVKEYFRLCKNIFI